MSLTIYKKTRHLEIKNLTDALEKYTGAKFDADSAKKSDLLPTAVDLNLKYAEEDAVKELRRYSAENATDYVVATAALGLHQEAQRVRRDINISTVGHNALMKSCLGLAYKQLYWLNHEPIKQEAE